MPDATPPGRILRFLRHPWMLFAVKLIVVIAPVALLSVLVHGAHLLAGESAQAVQEIVETPGALLSLALFALYTRRVEGRAVGELKWQGAPLEICGGFLLGMMAISVVLAALAALGLYHIDHFNSWTALLLPLYSCAGAALFEELLFRGVIFRIAEDSLGSYLAITLSAAIFGALHLANPNASLVAAIAIMIEAGIFLSAAYMLTRRLWLPIGVHAGWNFTEGGLWGVAVSGTTQPSLTQATLSGPAWLSGGPFGAEASLPAIIICGTIGVLLLQRVVRRGTLIAPFWRRNGSAVPHTAGAVEP